MVFKNLDYMRSLYSQKSLYQSLLILMSFLVYIVIMFFYNTLHPYIWSFSIGSLIVALMASLIYMHISGLNSIKRMEQLNILTANVFSTMDRRSFIKLEVDNT